MFRASWRVALVLFRNVWLCEIGRRISPDVMVEPGKIVLHDRSHRLGLGDSMAVSFVNDHLHLHSLVFQRLPQLVGVGYRNAAIQLAMLDQGRRPSVLDVRNGGCDSSTECERAASAGRFTTIPTLRNPRMIGATHEAGTGASIFTNSSLLTKKRALRYFDQRANSYEPHWYRRLARISRESLVR
jgi:hypothetical protein